MWKFPGQGSNPCHSYNPCHSCSKAGSLIHCATVWLLKNKCIKQDQISWWWVVQEDRQFGSMWPSESRALPACILRALVSPAWLSWPTTPRSVCQSTSGREEEEDKKRWRIRSLVLKTWPGLAQSPFTHLAAATKSHDWWSCKPGYGMWPSTQIKLAVASTADLRC